MNISFNTNIVYGWKEKVGVARNIPKVKNTIDIGTIVKAIQWTINAFPFAPATEKSDQSSTCSLYEKYAEDPTFLGMMDQCCTRLERHKADIGYLLKNGVSKEYLTYALCQDEYVESLKPFFSHLRIILGEKHNEAICNGEVTAQIEEWLKCKTTYRKILARRVKTPDTPKNFINGGKYFHLRKSTLQKIFITAEQMFSTSSKKTIWCLRESDLPGAFIAHKDKGNRCHLWHWSGRSDNLEDNSTMKLSEGTFGIVQTITNMERNETLVLKCAKKHLFPATTLRGNQSILNEIHLLNALASLDGSEGIMKLPYLTSTEESFTAYICKRYTGDLANFCHRLNDMPHFTIKDIYNAILNAAKGLWLLQRKKIAHLDIKPNNLFFALKKNNSNGYALSFVLGDLGMAASYSTIIKNKQVFGYISDYRLNNDREKLKKHLKSNDIAKIESLIEGREVYAFGKIIFEVLIGRQIQSNLSITTHTFFLKKFNIKQIYGKDIYNMLKKTHTPKVQDRLRVEGIVHALEAALNNPSQKEQTKLEQRFTRINI